MSSQREYAMSNTNISLVQSLYAAFGSGQIGAILDALTPDIDWQTVGRSKDYPAFGPRKGKAAVQEFFGIVAENEDFSDFSPHEFFSDADRVFVLGTYAGKLKKTGKPFASEWVHVFTIKNGKVAKFREHTDTAQFAEGYRG
jgi:ketosteroid isomerase-like protein